MRTRLRCGRMLGTKLLLSPAVQNALRRSMSTTMPMRIRTLLVTEQPRRRTRSPMWLLLHPNHRSHFRVLVRGLSTRITMNQNTLSMRQTWRMNISTTRLTRLTQRHQCTMDLTQKIPFPGKEVQAAGKGSPAQEEICKPALMFARVSLELKSMALVFSPVEEGVPDLLMSTNRLLNICTTTT